MLASDFFCKFAKRDVLEVSLRFLSNCIATANIASCVYSDSDILNYPFFFRISLHYQHVILSQSANLLEFNKIFCDKITSIYGEFLYESCPNNH